MCDSSTDGYLGIFELNSAPAYDSIFQKVSLTAPLTLSWF